MSRHQTTSKIKMTLENGAEQVRSRVSLKEKLSQHYKNRNFQAEPQTLNYFASTYCWYVKATCLYLALNLTGEVFKDDEQMQYISSVICVVMVAEITLHWILTARKSTITYHPQTTLQDHSTSDKELIENRNKDSEDWQQCITCQHKAPPRSHHCNLCNFCILKCDHHCFFVSNCIGFQNQKYFIIWLFWLSVSLSYMSYLLITYLIAYNSSIAAFFIPPLTIYQYAVADITAWDLFLYWHVYLSVMSTVGSFLYLFWQLWIIKQGQTTTEFFSGITKYNQGFWQNFRSVFGPYWLITIFVPLPFKQEGNGIDWDIKKH